MDNKINEKTVDSFSDTNIYNFNKMIKNTKTGTNSNDNNSTKINNNTKKILTNKYFSLAYSILYYK